MILLHVNGTPAPKGSARAIRQGAFARLVPSSSDANRKAQAAWVRAVRSSAAPNLVPLVGPVECALTFRLARPDAHYGTGRNANTLKASAPACPIVKPDIDKLVRCTLDALTGMAFEDDSRIVWLTVRKCYATRGQEGAEVRVWQFVQQEAA